MQPFRPACVWPTIPMTWVWYYYKTIDILPYNIAIKKARKHKQNQCQLCHLVTCANTVQPRGHQCHLPISLSLSGVCVCQPVFLSVYITVSTSSINLSASSQLIPHFLPTISIAPAPGPHVSVILWSCNGCNSSTLSRYFTYSSAIAVDDSAKMSFRNKMPQNVLQTGGPGCRCPHKFSFWCPTAYIISI